MKRLLTYIGVVGAISCLVSVWFYLHLNKVYGKHTSMVNEVLDYVQDSTDYNDILYIGNSRVWVQINPRIIDSVTGLSSHCVSLDGTDIQYHVMLLKKYLQAHPKPKLVFLSVDFSSLNTNQIVYNFPDYYPYLNDSVIYNSIAPYSFKFRYEPVKRFYAFQKLTAEQDDHKLDLWLQLLKGNSPAPHTTKRKNSLYRGFAANPAAWDVNEKIKPFKEPCNEEAFKLLQDFVSICNKESIEVIFLQPPMYEGHTKVVENIAEVDARIDKIVISNHVPFWKYTDMWVCRSTTYFYNMEHLNAAGAEIFSQKFALDIKSYLQRANKL